MRLRFLLLAALSSTLFADPAVAAEGGMLRGQKPSDASGSPMARDVGAMVRETLRRRAERPSLSPAPTSSVAAGWTVTKIGNVTFVQDDGSHGCAGTFDNAWFDSCLAGSGAAIDAFYEGNPGADPDFLATYLAWDINQFFAFYSSVANDVEGIGQDRFGSPSGLQGLIFMNSVQLYDLAGPANRRVLFDLIWGQEVGHRWGAFVRFDDDGSINNAIQGRDYNNGGGHWSYFFDTDWSWMEGNDWRDNGDGTFTTDLATFGQVPGYSALDLYVMGLIPPSAVPDQWYIEGASGNREDPPEVLFGSSRTVSGTRRTFRIDDVITTEGPRNPSFDRSRRSWQTNLLVILRSTDTIPGLDATMAEFENWTTDGFSRDTSNLAYVSTVLGPVPANTMPAAALAVPASAKRGKEAALDASATTDADGDALAYVWDFGDGTGQHGTAAVVDHAFRRSGALTVTLTVVDQFGGYETITQPINVAAAKDDGLLGCGCALTGTAPTGTNAAGSMIALLLIGLISRRRRG